MAGIKKAPIVKEYVEPAMEIPKVSETSNFYPINGIPTDYRLYPEGTTIFGRPLKTREVKLLAGMDETNFNFIISEILQAATKGIDVQEMYVADKLYILFWLRANTYKNEGYSTEFNCSHCGNKNHYLFSMDKIRIEVLKEDFDPTKQIKLLNSDNSVTISFPKVKDEHKVSQMLKANKTAAVPLDEDILSLASMIKSVNGEELTLRFTYEFINSLDAEDYAYLKSYVDDNEIGVSPVVSAICEKEECQEENLIEVRFHSEFFLPKYQHR